MVDESFNRLPDTTFTLCCSSKLATGMLYSDEVTYHLHFVMNDANSRSGRPFSGCKSNGDESVR